MREICDCKWCDYQPILKKLTRDNFEEVIWNNGRRVLHRKHLAIYHVMYVGEMESEDNLWVKSVSYNSINDYCTHYTCSIYSFIENFIPIILADFEERLLNEIAYNREVIAKVVATNDVLAKDLTVKVDKILDKVGV